MIPRNTVVVNGNNKSVDEEDDKMKTNVKESQNKSDRLESTMSSDGVIVGNSDMMLIKRDMNKVNDSDIEKVKVSDNMSVEKKSEIQSTLPAVQIDVDESIEMEFSKIVNSKHDHSIGEENCGSVNVLINNETDDTICCAMDLSVFENDNCRSSCILYDSSDQNHNHNNNNDDDNNCDATDFELTYDGVRQIINTNENAIDLIKFDNQDNSLEDHVLTKIDNKSHISAISHFETEENSVFVDEMTTSGKFYQPSLHSKDDNYLIENDNSHCLNLQKPSTVEIITTKNCMNKEKERKVPNSPSSSKIPLSDESLTNKNVITDISSLEIDKPDELSYNHKNMNDVTSINRKDFLKHTENDQLIENSPSQFLKSTYNVLVGNEYVSLEKNESHSLYAAEKSFLNANSNKDVYMHDSEYDEKSYKCYKESYKDDQNVKNYPEICKNLYESYKNESLCTSDDNVDDEDQMTLKPLLNNTYKVGENKKETYKYENFTLRNVSPSKNQEIANDNENISKNTSEVIQENECRIDLKLIDNISEEILMKKSTTNEFKYSFKKDSKRRINRRGSLTSLLKDDDNLTEHILNDDVSDSTSNAASIHKTKVNYSLETETKSKRKRGKIKTELSETNGNDFKDEISLFDIQKSTNFLSNENTVLRTCELKIKRKYTKRTNNLLKLSKDFSENEITANNETSTFETNHSVNPSFDSATVPVSGELKPKRKYTRKTNNLLKLCKDFSENEIITNNVTSTFETNQSVNPSFDSATVPVSGELKPKRKYTKRKNSSLNLSKNELENEFISKSETSIFEGNESLNLPTNTSKTLTFNETKPKRKYTKRKVAFSNLNNDNSKNETVSHTKDSIFEKNEFNYLPSNVTKINETIASKRKGNYTKRKDITIRVNTDDIKNELNSKIETSIRENSKLNNPLSNAAIIPNFNELKPKRKYNCIKSTSLKTKIRNEQNNYISEDKNVHFEIDDLIHSQKAKCEQNFYNNANEKHNNSSSFLLKNHSSKNKFSTKHHSNHIMIPGASDSPNNSSTILNSEVQQKSKRKYTKTKFNQEFTELKPEIGNLLLQTFPLDLYCNKKKDGNSTSLELMEKEMDERNLDLNELILSQEKQRKSSQGKRKVKGKQPLLKKSHPFNQKVSLRGNSAIETTCDSQESDKNNNTSTNKSSSRKRKHPRNKLEDVTERQVSSIESKRFYGSSSTLSKAQQPDLISTSSKKRNNKRKESSDPTIIKNVLKVPKNDLISSKIGINKASSVKKLLVENADENANTNPCYTQLRRSGRPPKKKFDVIEQLKDDLLLKEIENLEFHSKSEKNAKESRGKKSTNKVILTTFPKNMIVKTKRPRYVMNTDNQHYLNSCEVNGQLYCIGDFVMLKSKNFKKVGKILAIYTYKHLSSSSSSSSSSNQFKKNLLIGRFFSAQKYTSKLTSQPHEMELFATRRRKVYTEDEIINKCSVLGFRSYNKLLAFRKKFESPLHSSESMSVISFEPIVGIEKPLGDISDVFFCRKILTLSTFATLPIAYDHM